MKKNKKKLLIIVLAFVLIVSFILSYFALDKTRYTSERKNISEHMLLLKSSAVITNSQYDEYCSYGHQKYSKGGLSCTVAYSFASEAKAEPQISAMLGRLNWLNERTNTSSLLANENGIPILSKVYKHNGLTCRYTVRTKNQKDTYYIGCYGPAKAEWFPVR